MGAWGYKALDSDEGLDVVDFISDYISSKYPGTKKVDLKLAELIDLMKENEFLSESYDEIDFYYDNSAMALAELYFMFQQTGQLDYDYEEDESRSLRKRIQSFTGDESSFKFLFKSLMDIKNEVPDQDEEREIVELWKESKSYDKWKDNLETLIEGLNLEIMRSND